MNDGAIGNGFFHKSRGKKKNSPCTKSAGPSPRCQLPHGGDGEFKAIPQRRLRNEMRVERH